MYAIYSCYPALTWIWFLPEILLKVILYCVINKISCWNSYMSMMKNVKIILVVILVRKNKENTLYKYLSYLILFRNYIHTFKFRFFNYIIDFYQFFIFIKSFYKERNYWNYSNTIIKTWKVLSFIRNFLQNLKSHSHPILFLYAKFIFDVTSLC